MTRTFSAQAQKPVTHNLLLLPVANCFLCESLHEHAKARSRKASQSPDLCLKRAMLGAVLGVKSRSVHAYIIGEHSPRRAGIPLADYCATRCPNFEDIPQTCASRRTSLSARATLHLSSLHALRELARRHLSDGAHNSASLDDDDQTMRHRRAEPALRLMRRRRTHRRVAIR